MKKFLVIMLVALTLGVAINAVLPDLSFAGAENAIASAITAHLQHLTNLRPTVASRSRCL